MIIASPKQLDHMCDTTGASKLNGTAPAIPYDLNTPSKLANTQQQKLILKKNPNKESHKNHRMKQKRQLDRETTRQRETTRERDNSTDNPTERQLDRHLNRETTQQRDNSRERDNSTDNSTERQHDRQTT